LTILVAYGSNRSMNSCRSKVGTGSSEHDFIGDFMTISRTSASVYWRKDVGDDGAWLITAGGGNSAGIIPDVIDFLCKNIQYMHSIQI